MRQHKEDPKGSSLALVKNVVAFFTRFRSTCKKDFPMNKIRIAEVLLSVNHYWKLSQSEIELVKQLKFDVLPNNTGNRTLYNISFK